MDKPNRLILTDKDFTIKKIPGNFIVRINFERLEAVAREKLFTQTELDDFVFEVENVAKACKIKLPENYFYPYNKYFFGLYANRAQGHCYGSGSEVVCALKDFNILQDFLANKA